MSSFSSSSLQLWPFCPPFKRPTPNWGWQFCPGGLFPLPSSSACTRHSASISTGHERKHRGFTRKKIRTPISSYESSGAPYKIWNTWKKHLKTASMPPFSRETTQYPDPPQQLRVVQGLVFWELVNWIIKCWQQVQSNVGLISPKQWNIILCFLIFSTYTFGNLANHRFGPQTYLNDTLTILHSWSCQISNKESNKDHNSRNIFPKLPRAIHATPSTNVSYFGAEVRPSCSVYAKFFGILDYQHSISTLKSNHGAVCHDAGPQWCSATSEIIKELQGLLPFGCFPERQDFDGRKHLLKPKLQTIWGIWPFLRGMWFSLTVSGSAWEAE